VGIATQQGLSIDFASPMSAPSVADSLRLNPIAAVHMAWSEDARHLHVTPAARWQTDTRYELEIPASAQLANGSVLGAPLRFAFTTQTAPTVTSFSVIRVGASTEMATRLAMEEAATQQLATGQRAIPADTADKTSARVSVTIGFSAAMNREEVERGFLVSPTVKGTFAWRGASVTFTPSSRLDPSARYAIAVVGAHDAQGNPLGGDLSFSFNTVSPVHVLHVSPANGARGVKSRTVTVLFSGAVDTAATGRAFRLVDLNTKRLVAGSLKWNTARTLLRYAAKDGLAAGHRFEIRVARGSADADGNSILATYRFYAKSAARRVTTRTRTPTSTYRPVYSAPAPSGNAASYALALINASRSAYGFSPLRLDASLSAVAQAHATDQVVNGYFSHNSLNGMTPEDRMRAAGISFSRSGENQCYDYGSVTSAIAWCHSIMMAEPYPGYWNHIGNILSPNFTRVGFGYAVKSNGEVIMTWDFAN
jgi:uncharacterized protein YkwD